MKAKIRYEITLRNHVHNTQKEERIDNAFHIIHYIAPWFRISGVYLSAT